MAMRPRRFHGSARLDPQRLNRDVARLTQKVVEHPTGLVGTAVEVTVEIQATHQDGFPEDVVRMVSENAHGLHLLSHGFEEVLTKRGPSPGCSAAAIGAIHRLPSTTTSFGEAKRRCSPMCEHQFSRPGLSVPGYAPSADPSPVFPTSPQSTAAALSHFAASELYAPLISIDTFSTSTRDRLAHLAVRPQDATPRSNAPCHLPLPDPFPQ